MDALNKVYLEPTNRCNLHCVTCIRRSWNEPFGEMDWSVYESLIGGLTDLPGPKTIAFAGLGEPLLHERLVDMVALAHARGLRTEMTSNALLLTPALGEDLLAAGLNQLTVSIDGAGEEALGAIRPGASLARIKANVGHLYWRSEELRGEPLRVGIEFVAMRRNIHELPALRETARAVRASFVLVTNVLPYTAELQDEILYQLGPTTSDCPGNPDDPLWLLPHLDWTQETQPTLSRFMRQQPRISFLDTGLDRRNNHCPFVQPGSLAVGWHGGISPCPPLLHTYRCFIRGREKTFRRCEFGRLPQESLAAVWQHPGYVAFRERVRRFDFSPCTDCGGCDLAETNEEDCFGNPFPVCGDCLWARGVLRCA